MNNRNKKIEEAARALMDADSSWWQEVDPLIVDALADALALPVEPEGDGWIPVSERLPEIDQLVWAWNGAIQEAVRIDDSKTNLGHTFAAPYQNRNGSRTHYFHVSHWRVPDPPKETP